MRQSVGNLNAQRASERDSRQDGLSAGLSMPYELREEGVTARQGISYNGYAHSFACMGVQFILFMGIDVGIGVLLQRHRSLWQRLRSSTLSLALLLRIRT